VEAIAASPRGNDCLSAQQPGRVVTFREFDELQRREAEDARLGIELDLNRKGIDHEVVMLDAASEDALRRTHRRYFEDLRQILEDTRRREKKESGVDSARAP